MPSLNLFFTALVLFQVKHFIADYLLQPGWMLRGKGSFIKFGGYAHAGLHASLSAPIFAWVGLEPGLIVALSAVEFCIHYLIDYGKSNFPSQNTLNAASRLYWVLHGGDQLLHHLTYALLLLASLDR